MIFQSSLSTLSGARRYLARKSTKEHEEGTEKNLRALRFFVVDFRGGTGGERIGKRV
jgi:hypothetical protein